MLHRDIYSLTKEFQPIALDIIITARNKYAKPFIVNETKRDQDVQSAYYAQGRKPLSEVNDLRKKAGLYLLSGSENESIVTNRELIRTDAGHGAGLALDVYPEIGWRAPQSYWKIIKLIIDNDINPKYKEFFETNKCHIEWGGEWKLKDGSSDSPHIELVYEKE